MRTIYNAYKRNAEKYGIGLNHSELGQRQQKFADLNDRFKEINRRNYFLKEKINIEPVKAKLEKIGKLLGLHTKLKDDFLAVEIPSNFQDLKEHQLNIAIDWRLKTREVFEEYFAKNYMVVDFITAENPFGTFYVLKKIERALASNGRRAFHGEIIIFSGFYFVDFVPNCLIQKRLSAIVYFKI